MTEDPTRISDSLLINGIPCSYNYSYDIAKEKPFKLNSQI